MSVRFSFVFGFRNRDSLRVKRCLDSLALQDMQDFEVIFTDFGSDPVISAEIENLCQNYSFVRYIFNNVRGFPWNRSYALNTGVRHAVGKFIIFGDIDMIYSSHFLSTVNSEARADKNLYGENFKLPENFSDWDKLNSYDVTQLENFGSAGKGGVHIVDRELLISIGGYDEFYCFWGVEDRDLNYRLTQSGIRECWLNNQAPVFHQWHPLTSDLYTSGFPMQWWEDMNIYFEDQKKHIVRNNGKWGELLDEKDRPVLNETFPAKDVKLESNVKNSVVGKAAIINAIYNQLEDLKSEERLKFTYEKSKRESFPVIPQSRSIYFARLVERNEWINFERSFSSIKKEFQSYQQRINYFFPEDDLQYIFWKIIRLRNDLDFSINHGDGKLEWMFAKK